MMIVSMFAFMLIPVWIPLVGTTVGHLTDRVTALSRVE